MNKKEVLEAALRGEGCLGRCADDEPVFVIVGRDRLAPIVVNHWINLAEAVGSTKAKIGGARRDMAAIREWQDAHGSKVPD